MIFIKNFYKPEDENDVNGKDIGVFARQADGGAVIMGITTPEGDIPLLTSEATGIVPSIKKSVEYIGRKTGYIYKESNGSGNFAVSANLLDNAATEVVFYIKGSKVSLNPIAEDGHESEVLESVISIDKVTEEQENAEENKRYPRDVIAFLMRNDGKGISMRYDQRNVSADPICVLTEKYKIALVIPRWPVWANLKFPCYIVLGDAPNGELENYTGAVKLGFRTENGAQRNQLDEVPVEEAVNFIDETDRLAEEKRNEKAMQRSFDKLNEKNGNFRRGKNNMQNDKGNRKGTGVPPMFVKGQNGKARPVVNNGKNKNFRKSGNR